MNIKVIAICTYRDWGIKTSINLQEIFPSINFILIKSEDEFITLEKENKLPKIIFCIGWSSIISSNLVREKTILGVHPSDLPEYSGGSPIQNQIINGITNSKMTLFKISEELDSGPYISKLPLSLEGHIKDIFKRMEYTSTILFRDFITSYPNNIFIDINRPSKCFKRIKPEDSELTMAMFEKLSLKEIFDLIRCREDPYPNCFLKDSSGKLIFKFCEFEKSSD
ncbi:MAG: hypothetical protein CMP49_04570 [Flavobacteriales bacterium]|nr:hypothetical protein [Flavobacteriales bacterium]